MAAAKMAPSSSADDADRQLVEDEAGEDAVRAVEGHGGRVELVEATRARRRSAGRARTARRRRRPLSAEGAPGRRAGPRAER